MNWASLVGSRGSMRRFANFCLEIRKARSEEHTSELQSRQYIVCGLLLEKKKNLIADEDVAITVTNSGYIKRKPITTYQRQGRGGKGRFVAAAKNSDFVVHLLIGSTHAYL